MNDDVLLSILLRSDDTVIGKLSATSLWPRIKVLISRDNFWHLRTETLVDRELPLRPDLDWKRIYHDLADPSTVNNARMYLINDLELTKIMTEVYGPYHFGTPNKDD